MVAVHLTPTQRQRLIFIRELFAYPLDHEVPLPILHIGILNSDLFIFFPGRLTCQDRKIHTDYQLLVKAPV